MTIMTTSVVWRDSVPLNIRVGEKKIKQEERTEVLDFGSMSPVFRNSS